MCVIFAIASGKSMLSTDNAVLVLYDNLKSLNNKNNRSIIWLTTYTVEDKSEDKKLEA